MVRPKLTFSGRTSRRCVGLLALVLVLGVAGCGGAGGEAEPAPETGIEKVEGAAVGETIEGAGWRVTLLDAPERMKMLGGEVLGGEGVGEYVDFGTGVSYSDDDITADGVFLALAVEVANVSDEEQYLSSSTLQVMDSGGQGYKAGAYIEHTVFVWITERWMKKEDIIIPGVMDPGVTVQGPAVYDVPEDATGLKLVIDGAEGSIDLGF